MAAFAGVGIYLVHQAAHAGLDVDVGVFAAHVGLHPAWMQRQHRRLGLAQLRDKAIGHRIEGGLAGLVQRQVRAVGNGHAAQYRTHEGQHAGVFADLPDKALGQVDWRHGVGEEQLADFRQGRVAGLLVGRALDAGVDEQQVEGAVFQALGQGDHGLLVVHIQLLDLHRPHGFQGIGLVRIAHGGGHVPAVLEQLLDQAKAQPARGADDQCGFWRRHERLPLKSRFREFSA